MQRALFSFGKRPGQQLVAANAAGHTNTSRLFYVYDWSTHFRFLVDTGAEVSVLPPSTTERTCRQDYTLKAANGATIVTYGTRSLTLDLGLGRTLHELLFHPVHMWSPVF